MTRSPLTEIHTCADLVGFWQFSAGGQPHFGVLERDDDGTLSTLSIGTIAGAESRIIKKVENEDVSVRALDVALVGTQLIFALEFNRGRALQLERAEAAAVIDPAVPEIPFQLVREINLAEPHSLKVQLPAERKWHAVDMPKPVAWLFSPRLVRGPVQTPAVIANTADGQAVLLGADAPADRDFIPNAAEPQEYRRDGHRYIAFQRQAEPYYPFWMLPRYSGEDPRAGELTVVIDGGEPRNLSADMPIGPVIGFALLGDAAGVPWIFALRPAGDSTRVAALALRDGRWSVADDWEVEGRGQFVSAERSADGWHLVFAMRTATGWSLRHQFWPG